MRHYGEHDGDAASPTDQPSAESDLNRFDSRLRRATWIRGPLRQLPGNGRQSRTQLVESLRWGTMTQRSCPALIAVYVEVRRGI